MKLRFLSTIGLIGLSLPLANATTNGFRYSPATVEVAGTLETQTFPGPPGYKSIQNGDKLERGWFLRLDHPINVLANSPPTDLGWKTENNVEILHMVIKNDQLWQSLKNGKQVTVNGKLFQRQNGHHHSRVLIEVNQMTEVKR
jgi:hypothetical protein